MGLKGSQIRDFDGWKDRRSATAPPIEFKAAGVTLHASGSRPDLPSPWNRFHVLREHGLTAVVAAKPDRQRNKWFIDIVTWEPEEGDHPRARGFAKAWRWAVGEASEVIPAVPRLLAPNHMRVSADQMVLLVAAIRSLASQGFRLYFMDYQYAGLNALLARTRFDVFGPSVEMPPERVVPDEEPWKSWSPRIEAGTYPDRPGPIRQIAPEGLRAALLTLRLPVTLQPDQLRTIDVTQYVESLTAALDPEAKHFLSRKKLRILEKKIEATGSMADERAALKAEKDEAERIKHLGKKGRKKLARRLAVATVASPQSQDAIEKETGRIEDKLEQVESEAKDREEELRALAEAEKYGVSEQAVREMLEAAGREEDEVEAHAAGIRALPEDVGRTRLAEESISASEARQMAQAMTHPGRSPEEMPEEPPWWMDELIGRKESKLDVLRSRLPFAIEPHQQKSLERRRREIRNAGLLLWMWAHGYVEVTP